MQKHYRGAASEAAMAPLLKIADLPNDTQLVGNFDVGFSVNFGQGETMTLAFEDDMPRLTFCDASGIKIFDGFVRALGRIESDAFWYPFAPIFEQVEFADPTCLSLTSVIEHVRTLLERAEFFEPENETVPIGSRPRAAAEYLRAQSGVGGRWLLYLRAPFFLRVDDDEISVEDMVMSLNTLPPGLDELGERALIDSAPGNPSNWWLCPAVLVLDDADLSSEAGDEALASLVELGFSEEEISALDRVARRVADAYDVGSDPEHEFSVIMEGIAWKGASLNG
jgi:hypothetical protein